MRDNVQTSLVGETPEITAPFRLEGQSNSEVLFNWLVINRYLWMLKVPYDAELETIVGDRARFHLGYRLIKWKREANHGEGHPALAVPASSESRQSAYWRLERVIRYHLLDSGESEHD